MEDLLYDILKPDFLEHVKDFTNIRNVRIKDLTESELRELFLLSTNIKKFRLDNLTESELRDSFSLILIDKTV